jgi:hypothetical protein
VTYSDVTCERVEPIAPEAYICAWADRNRLELALLGDKKGSRTSFRPGVKDKKGIVGRDYAYIVVESYH